MNTQLNKLLNSKGRFVSLNVVNSKRRESISAKFVNESEQYVTIFDSNEKSNRKIKKTSLV